MVDGAHNMDDTLVMNAQLTHSIRSPISPPNISYFSFSDYDAASVRSEDCDDGLLSE